MVRSLFIYEPKDPINVFVGWCANDYQIDVGTPEGRAEYRRVFDQAAASGAQYVLYAPSNSALSRREDSVDDWSWEHVLWLGLGQKIRRNEWDPAIERRAAERHGDGGLRARQAVEAARVRVPGAPLRAERGVARARRATTRDGRRRASAAARCRTGSSTSWSRFTTRTGIGGYSFDHTFLTFDGTSRYAQWWGWRRVMETLRRRIPDIVIDGRQAYHLYGPWSWLAGSYPHPTFNDEQPESFTPYPDLHFDRVSADRERWTAYRYRNYEFLPSELVPGFITHQTSRSDDRGDMPSRKTPDRGTVLTSYRARDWDYLGWRYSLLSSIAVAGWNNVLDMLPARDSAENASVLGARIAHGFAAGCSGRWRTRNCCATRARSSASRRSGKIDGTSAIVGDHGFLFLFNPDARRLEARVPLDATDRTCRRRALRAARAAPARRSPARQEPGKVSGGAATP